MESINFITSFLTFYLKGSISGDQKFINLRIPNTFLGCIPLGTKNETVPVSQISAVDTNFKILAKSIIVGLIIFSIGGGLTNEFILSFILRAWGVFMILGAFQTKLDIRTTSGDTKSVYFIVFEKSKAEAAASSILHLVSDHLDSTNVRLQTDRMIHATERQADRE